MVLSKMFPSMVALHLGGTRGLVKSLRRPRQTVCNATSCRETGMALTRAGALLNPGWRPSAWLGVTVPTQKNIFTPFFLADVPA